MFVCDSRRMLFIHVQKTGGITITRLLADALPDGRVGRGPRTHDLLPWVLRREPGLAGYWTFGVVRNPWARMVSWWSMVRDRQARAEAGSSSDADWIKELTLRQAIAAMPDFDTFIAEAPGRWEAFRRPQVRWLTSPTRRADFVGRTETLAADIRAVFARFDLPLPDELPRANPSNHTDYRDYYTPATRARVGEIFAPDIATFGYEF